MSKVKEYIEFVNANALFPQMTARDVVNVAQLIVDAQKELNETKLDSQMEVVDNV